MAISAVTSSFEASDARRSDEGMSQARRGDRRRSQCEQEGDGVIHGTKLREEFTGAYRESSQEASGTSGYRQVAAPDSAPDQSEHEPAHRRVVQQGGHNNGGICGPSCDHLDRIPKVFNPGACDNNDNNECAVASWPPPASGASSSDGEAECPPATHSFRENSDTSLFSPQRYLDTQPCHRHKAEPSPTVTDAVASEVGMFEAHGSIPFLARQELERQAANRRREEAMRGEDRARQAQSSRGSWMNPTSRAILARYSCGGGGGASPSSPRGRRGKGGGQPVFERLARRACERDTQESFQHGNEHESACRTWTVTYDGCGGGSPGRQPFQPRINPRSTKLASGMPHRDEGTLAHPEQRLHRDVEEQLRKREQMVQLAKHASPDNFVASFVSVGSERALAKRSKSRTARVRSKILELVKVG